MDAADPTPERDALAGVLRRHRDALAPRLSDLAADAYEDDPAFRERLDGWIRRNDYGNPDPEERVGFAADGYVLLLLSAALPAARDNPGRVPDATAVVESARAAAGPFAAFSEDPGIGRAVSDLLSALADAPAPRGDPIAPLYEEALPEEGRRAGGQFYTPPRLAEALARWALAGTDGAPTVLDPAAGSGAVLAAARDRLAERGVDRGTIPDRLVGIDVDRLALELAARSLGGPDEGGLRAYHASFFDVEPGEPPPEGTRLGPEGEAVGPVDAVVGNPPFLRAEEVDTEAFRRHLGAFDGVEPSRRSDAYVYFLTHATRFLRPGGRLAFVLPTKWLQSEYGEDLQRFLLDRYRVHAVVGSTGRAFEDALVDTCLLFAERRENAAATGADPVRFVRTGGAADTEGILRAVRGEESDGVAAEGGAATTSDGARVVARRRSELDPGRLHRYLTAPADLLDLPSSPAFVPLADLADVSRGVMTGANRFFFIEEEDVDEWGIEPRFLTPARKSVRGLDTRAFEPGDVDRYVIDVHDYVASLDGDPATADVERALEREGHDGLLAYVRHAEAEGWHEGRTCRSRRVWFDLGVLPVPDVFVPKLLRERVFVIANRAGAVPGNAIDCLSVRDGVDATALVGVLESTLSKAIMEVWGRDEAGMLQLMTYETGTLPVPDVRALAPAERRRIAGATDALLSGAGSLGDLDAAVLAALPLDLSVERVRELRERLLRRRVDAGAGPTRG